MPKLPKRRLRYVPHNYDTSLWCDGFPPSLGATVQGAQNEWPFGSEHVRMRCNSVSCPLPADTTPITVVLCVESKGEVISGSCATLVLCGKALQDVTGALAPLPSA
ncbi:hypothetical protein AAFF_G00305740 [Aldrovandia affinis]|uniref:Uncharacterized protein n=1 Tax=Aldrovandia affinis TaxID=143900 RepID=A0AAD7SPQ0_9TELE|nr:hypothetical protein AAFF_G00305740 [Aldrovandia affinis]